MDGRGHGEDSIEPRGGSLQAGNDKAGKRSYVSIAVSLETTLKKYAVQKNVNETFANFSELESTVEELRGNVINRKTRVNMSDVENMALILSKSR